MSADKLVMDETSPSFHPLPNSYRFMSANPFLVFLKKYFYDYNYDYYAVHVLEGNGSGYVVRMADRGLVCQLFHYIWPHWLDMLMEIVEPHWQKPSCSQKEWVIRLFGSFWFSSVLLPSDMLLIQLWWVRISLSQIKLEEIKKRGQGGWQQIFIQKIKLEKRKPEKQKETEKGTERERDD